MDTLEILAASAFSIIGVATAAYWAYLRNKTSTMKPSRSMENLTSLQEENPV